MRFITLLRGINVGGNKQVAMADLRQLLAGLGLKDVQSLLQSGNLVFSTDSLPIAELEPTLKAAAKNDLKLDLEFVVRSAAEWEAIVRRNPFPEQATRDASHLLVMCMSKSPAQNAISRLRKEVVGREAIVAIGRELYITYPDGIGRSRLTHALVERTLGTTGTARNWNTVLKISKLLFDE